ncbi:MAG: hypothetical protein KDA22_10080 [Phycisphaerales bacterium]|nr:hypothetical protein [Phycisphaerales bacterium]
MSGRSTEGGSCPECGRALDAPRAIRLGRRRRRPTLIALGLVALVAGGGSLAVTIAGRSSLIAYKPVWLLAWEMNHGSSGDRQAAFDELERRWDASLLGPADRQRFALACLDGVYDLEQPWRPEWDWYISATKVPLSGDPRTPVSVDTILRAQGDSATLWRAAWGDRIEWFRANGLLTSDDWARYLRQGVDAGIAVGLPARIRAESSAWIECKYAEPRFGTPIDAFAANDWRSGLALRIEPQPLLRDGARVDVRERSWGAERRAFSWHQGSVSDRFGARSEIRHDLQPGDYTLEQPVEFTICPWTQSSGPGGANDADVERTIVRWTRSFDLPVEVVPDAVPLVEMLDYPGVESAVRAAVAVRSLRRDEKPATLYAEPFEVGADRAIEVKVENPSIDIALSIWLRHGEHEVLLGKVALRRCSNCSTSPVLPWPDGEWLDGLDRVDVVLRPDREVAESQGMAWICARELVLPEMSTKRLPFREAPKEEQAERLREAIDLMPLLLNRRHGDRAVCQVMIQFLGTPVALRHRVACRVAELTSTVGEVTTAVGGRAFLSGIVEFDDSELPTNLELLLEPIAPTSVDSQDDAWAEPVVVPVQLELDLWGVRSTG